MWEHQASIARMGRDMDGVYFVSLNSDLYPASSCYIGPRYNGPWLYSVNTHIRTNHLATK